MNVDRRIAIGAIRVIGDVSVFRLARAEKSLFFIFIFVFAICHYNIKKRGWQRGRAGLRFAKFILQYFLEMLIFPPGEKLNLKNQPMGKLRSGFNHQSRKLSLKKIDSWLIGLRRVCPGRL